MFLSFNLHSALISFSGIDLTHFRDERRKTFPGWKAIRTEKRLAAVFNRTWFGNHQSPETCVRCYYLAEEIIRGDPFDPDNLLRFNTVIINAVGTDQYNPALPNAF